MSSTFMRKLMEAVEENGANPFVEYKNEFLEKLEQVEQNPGNFKNADWIRNNIKNRELPKLNTIIEHGRKNPGNILINPWKSGTRILGDDNSYIISGTPKEVLNKIQNGHANFAKIIGTSLSRYQRIGNEKITWQGLHIAFNLPKLRDLPTYMPVWSYLAIGEGEEYIDDIRLYKPTQENQPHFIVNGKIIKTERKLHKFTDEI